MRLSRLTRSALAVLAVTVAAFLFAPLAVIILFAFGRSNVQTFPIRHWTTYWFSVAWNDPAVRSALWLSLKADFFAAPIALVLDVQVAFRIHRFECFGSPPM